MANIRRNSLFHRLIERYQLEPETLEPATMLEVVLPTIDADKILQTPTVARDANFNFQTGGVVHTVPSGERWSLIWLFKEATTGNGRLKVKISGTLINITAQGTTEIATGFPAGFILEAGDTMEADGTSNAGDSARNVSLFYLKELLTL
ncbi:MAG TPA: hypothetical protein EYO33_13905 [Phycisphaerales bacterium]|nr:hypothetical protein [Phycisphaerales bacterium]